MRHLAVIAALGMTATPVAAYETASTQECKAMWDTLFDAFPGDWEVYDDSGLVEPKATGDGWCRISGGSNGLQDADFGTIDWRVDGINRVIADGIPPMAIEIIAQEIGDDGSDVPPPVEVQIALRYAPEIRGLVVEQLFMRGADGDTLSLTTILEHLDFSSRGAVAMSMGGVAISQLAGRMTVKGDEDIFGIRGADATDRADMVYLLGKVESGSLTEGSLDAVAAFLDNNNPEGELNFSISSERGIGLVQMAMAPWINGDGEVDELLNRLLDGLTVDIEWEPLAQ